MKRRGMTIFELVLALMITSLIAAAAAALSMAVSRGWRNTESTSTADLVKLRAMTYLRKLFSEAKLIGTWRAGSLSAHRAAASSR